MKRAFAVGIYQYQHDCNVGTMFRSAYAYGADFLFTIGRKYKREASDTPNSIAQLPYFNYLSVEDFLSHIPHGFRLVCVETEGPNSKPIGKFSHPDRAMYLLGRESGGLPKYLLNKFPVVTIPNLRCRLNVSATASIVLAHRAIQKEV